MFLLRQSDYLLVRCGCGVACDMCVMPHRRRCAIMKTYMPYQSYINIFGPADINRPQINKQIIIRDIRDIRASGARRMD